MTNHICTSKYRCRGCGRRHPPRNHSKPISKMSRVWEQFDNGYSNRRRDFCFFIWPKSETSSLIDTRNQMIVITINAQQRVDLRITELLEAIKRRLWNQKIWSPNDHLSKESTYFTELCSIWLNHYVLESLNNFVARPFDTPVRFGLPVVR